MKIVLTNYTAFPFHGYGGAERYLFTLARELVKLGHEVHILTLRFNNSHKKDIIYNGINYHFFSIPFYGVFDIDEDFLGFRNQVVSQKITKLQKFCGRIKFWISITMWARSNSYDILHSFSDSGYPFAIAGIPQVATIFDIGNRNLRYLPSIRFPVSKTDYYSHTTTKIVQNAKIVTSGGPDNSIELIDIFRVDNNKISYLHNAIDLNKIKNLNYTEKNKIKNMLGFPEKSKIISIFGRLESNKNPIFAIDIFCSVLRNIKKDIRLLVIGDGNLRSEVDQKIEVINSKYNETKARRISNVPDDMMNDLLQVTDLILNFAETRYMLLIVMEAMANEVAVISSQTLDGILIHGKNGYLVDINPQDECMKCIKNLLSNDILLDFYKKNSLDLINDYSWENTTAQAIQIYNQFLAVTEK